MNATHSHVYYDLMISIDKMVSINGRRKFHFFSLFICVCGAMPMNELYGASKWVGWLHNNKKK